MADEPDNLVLVQLRDIRGKLDKMDDKLHEHDQRFDHLDKRFDEMRQYVIHALGLGSMNEMKAREVDARLEVGEAMAKRIDARFKDIERRVTKVEEKVD